MLLIYTENPIQLVPDGTLLLHIAIVIVMVYLLNATLFRPINQILEKREKHTRGHSNEAQEILQRVEGSLKFYEQSLREARAVGYHLLETERAEAIRQRQIKLNLLHEEIGHLVKEQKVTISLQSEQAITELKGDALRIASEISSQILERAVS